MLIMSVYIYRCVAVTAGVGGNLVAVQASRLSTALHRVSTPGQLPDSMTVGDSPWSAFCGKSMFPIY